MGKRVDFSARTVITPDPNLRIDQVSDTFFCQYFRFLFTLEKDILLRLRWNLELYIFNFIYFFTQKQV